MYCIETYTHTHSLFIKPAHQIAETLLIDVRLRLNVKWYGSSCTPIKLWDVTGHIRSHSIICHLTQVNVPCLTPVSGLVLDLPTLEGWKAELTEATRQCTGRESNSGSLDHKSDAPQLPYTTISQSCEGTMMSACCHRYLRYTLDKYVENDYTVVYFHFGLRSANKPSVSWLKRAYNEFDRK